MGLETQAVPDAAGITWNFHPYRSGLVGGHGIPADACYLFMKADGTGDHRQVILSGRIIKTI